MRLIVGAVLMIGLALSGAAAQSDWSAVAQKARSSVVQIIAHTKQGQKTGTGFAISADGKIATNHHVIENASKVFVKLSTGKTVGVSRIFASDKRVDLAILQLKGVKLRPLPLGDSNALKVGQDICVMGSPLGLQGSFSAGVVSAKRVLNGFEWIQITAPVSPGNSGSPVMTRSGAVVGVITFTVESGQNLNFATPVKYLRLLLGRRKIAPEPVQKSSSPTASRAPSSAQEPPSKILVTNAEELLEAIREVKDGGEITLQAGEYRLHQTLSTGKSLTIAGAGYEETVIVFEKGDAGISFYGSGVLSIRDLTVRMNSSETICLAVGVGSGELRLSRCFITGATGRMDKSVSCGVLLYGTARAVISECWVADNEVGILLNGSASARVEFCRVFANGDDGLSLGHSTSCEVRHSEFLRNGGWGMFAWGDARLTARNNTCEGNEQDGIGLFGSAQGTLEGNTCKGNGKHGIYAQDQAHLTARHNTCEGNRDGGISLFGSAQGTLEGNTCKGNGSHGIAGNEQSTLTARNNTCEGNTYSGIALFGSAQGTLEANTCKGNGSHGIYAQDQAHLTARHNTCEGNTYSGIALFGSAQGILEGNTCKGNGYHGIAGNEQSTLTARNNTCEGNKDCGIWLSDNVQGEVSGNRCVRNQYGIYVRDKTVKARLSHNSCWRNNSRDIHDVR